MIQAYPELLAAIRYLAARCDGARANDDMGYNGLDAGFGRSLSERDQWTPRQACAAHKMLRRYRKQLASGGIDYDTLPVPEIIAEIIAAKDSPKRVIIIAGGDIAAISSYDPDLIAWYREVKAFRWDKVARAWTTLVSPSVAPHIITLRDRWGFDVSDIVIDKLTTAIDAAEQSKAASHAATSDFDVPGLGGTLRPFQRAGVEYLISHPQCLLADEMGLGKTVQALAALKALDAFPALIICPASLKYNWKREAEHWLPGVSVAILNGNGKKRTSDNANPQITVINFDLIWREQYIDRLISGGYKAIILDESHYCFPAETLVLTNSGWLPIDEIVKNNLSVSVASCNLSSNVIEYKRITDWMQFPNYSHIVEVQHEHGKFRCTSDHKIWTEERGWTEAQSLISGETLRMVQWFVHDTNEGQDNSKVLLKPLCCKMENVTTVYPQEGRGKRLGKDQGHSKICTNQMPTLSHDYYYPCIQGEETKVLFNAVQSKRDHERPSSSGPVKDCYQKSNPSPYWQTPARCINTMDTQQSDVQYQTQGESPSSIIETGILIPEQRRQAKNHGTTAKTCRCTQMADGSYCSYSASQGYATQPSTVLSDRYCQRDTTNCNRSGWILPSNKEMAMDRQTQNCCVGNSRVVSVTLQERTGDERLASSLDRDQYIYNIAVEGNHNYFADGILVANCKERKSRRTQAAKDIAKQASVRLLLSGTPILSRPAELVSQLDAAGLLQHFGGAWAFLQRYTNAQQTPWGWDFSGASHLDELNDKLRAVGFIRRTKAQVLPELPLKQHTALPVSITNRAEYDNAESDIITYLSTVDWAKASAAERAEHLVKIEVLKQLTAHGKMASVTEWVADFLESGEKLVVFAHHIAVQEALLAAFPDAAHIMGEDKDTERQAAVDKFQTDPDCRLIICSLKAGGVGITLTAASNVLMVEYGWTPSDMSQAEDRCHRIGQMDSVNVWQMVGQETIDEQILSLLAAKCAVVDAATEGTVKDVKATESIAADLVAYLKSKGGAQK